MNVNEEFEKIKPPVDVRQSSIIKTYNSAMSFDQYLSYFRSAVKTRGYLAWVFPHFMSASVVNAFIIHKQQYNTNNAFQMNYFIKKLLIFNLVPEADPIFKRRHPRWEQDRTRLNTQEMHASFIQELPDDNNYYRR